MFSIASIFVEQKSTGVCEHVWLHLFFIYAEINDKKSSENSSIFFSSLTCCFPGIITHCTLGTSSRPLASCLKSGFKSWGDNLPRTWDTKQALRFFFFFVGPAYRCPPPQGPLVDATQHPIGFPRPLVLYTLPASPPTAPTTPSLVEKGRFGSMRLRPRDVGTSIHEFNISSKLAPAVEDVNKRMWFMAEAGRKGRSASGKINFLFTWSNKIC